MCFGNHVSHQCQPDACPEGLYLVDNTAQSIEKFSGVAAAEEESALSKKIPQ